MCLLSTGVAVKTMVDAPASYDMFRSTNSKKSNLHSSFRTLCTSTKVELSARRVSKRRAAKKPTTKSCCRKIAESITESGWQPRTKRKYVAVLRRFEAFCGEQRLECDGSNTSIDSCLSYLKHFYGEKRVLPTSAYAEAVSLQSVLGVKLLSSSPFQRWMRKITNEAGPRAPDDKSFKAKTLLDWIRTNWPDNSTLTLSDLLDKTLTLMALFFGCRPVDISRTETPELNAIVEACAEAPASLLIDPKNRRCRADIKKGVLEFRKVQFVPFVEDPSLCFCSVLSEYLRRTSESRSSNSKLFLYLSGVNGRSLGSERISKRISSVLSRAGLHDFTAKFCKRAGTSAIVRGADFPSMLEYGDWKDAAVARAHYDKRVFDFIPAWKLMTE